MRLLLLLQTDCFPELTNDLQHIKYSHCFFFPLDIYYLMYRPLNINHLLSKDMVYIIYIRSHYVFIQAKLACWNLSEVLS